MEAKLTGYDRSPDYGGPEPNWRRLGAAVAVATLLLVLLFSALAGAETLTGTVDKIVDGDTFWICEDNACHKIRLCGIDAPEKGKISDFWLSDNFGYDADMNYAEAALKLMVERGKTVRCVPVGEGTICDGRSQAKNGDRVVAQCFTKNLDGDEFDLSGALVDARLAGDWVKFSGGHYARRGFGHVCPAGHRPKR